MDPSPPTGVLVVTVWVEGETADHLRARVTSALDVTKSDQEQFSAEDREEVIERVRTWLTDFEDEHRKPQDSGDAGVTPTPRRPASVEPFPTGGRDEDGR